MLSRNQKLYKLIYGSVKMRVAQRRKGSCGDDEEERKSEGRKRKKRSNR